MFPVCNRQQAGGEVSNYLIIKAIVKILMTFTTVFSLNVVSTVINYNPL